MGWRDRYRQGSFRGVPFHMETGEDERSSRLIVHEFPGRDLPFVQDLGKRPTEFTVEAVLVGDDYLDRLDALQAACTKPGKGKLVHPFYGETDVFCRSIRSRHNNNELRVVRVQMQFVIVGSLSVVSVVLDTRARTLVSAREALEQQKTTFERVFDYASLPYNKAVSVQNAIDVAVGKIADARKLVGQAPAFARKIRNIGGSLSTLVLDVQQLALELIEVVTFGFLFEDQDDDGVPDLRQSFAGLSGLFNFSALVGSDSGTTQALERFIRGVALTQGGHLLSLIDFESVEEANELRSILFSSMDSYIELSDLDDDLYQSIYNLRSVVELDVKERSSNLPRLVEVLLPEFTPALVLSWRLYGNVDEEQSILQRNKIEHPGIVPSDVPIKVLTSDE